MGVSTDGIIFYGYLWDEEDNGKLIPEDAQELYGNAHKVLVGRHGSDGWTQPYIYVVESKITARRGYPKKLAKDQLTEIGPEWDDLLAEFVKNYNIDISEANGPAWFLVSWWG